MTKEIALHHLKHGLINEEYPLTRADKQEILKALEQEPTAKNCESCRYYGSHHEVCNYCYKCSLWTEGEPTTKNNLGVDKEQLKTMIRGLTKWYVKRDNTEVGEPNTAVGLLYDDVMFGIDRLPSVTPHEPRIITCRDCKYYRNKANKYSYCTKRLNVDSVTDRYREPNFYCADAVLREVKG